jgi:hypothetical protein
MLEGLLDVVINSIDQGTLLNDQIIQFLVDPIQLVDRFNQIGNLTASLLIIAYLGFANLHVLELIFHLFAIFLPELDG